MYFPVLFFPFLVHCFPSKVLFVLLLDEDIIGSFQRVPLRPFVSWDLLRKVGVKGAHTLTHSTLLN